MPAVEIRPDVFWIGMNDRTTDLFEGIWPIAAEGVTYNTYLVRDERSAVIDLAKAIKTDQFLEQVDEVVPLADIDYLVINHMEPDHTGAIRMLSRIPRRLTILTTEKAKAMLDGLLRHHRERARGGRRRDRGAGAAPAHVPPRPVRALARDHGDVRAGLEGAVLLRRLRRLRRVQRLGLRRRVPRPRLLRAREPALLRQHRGQVQRPDAARHREARGRAHRDHRAVARPDLAEEPRPDRRAVPAVGRAREGRRSSRR